MKINFTKMNGLGNDFIILDYVEYLKIDKTQSELAKILCNRNFSIGADGLIILNPETENADMGWIFYNSDGTVAQMCGNGMRCFAKYVTDKKYVLSNDFSVETLAGIIKPEILSNGLVKVNMNKPIFQTSKIPSTFKGNLDNKYSIDNETFDLNVVSMGNPHCIIFTDGNTMEYAKKYGSKIETCEFFPEKTNVEFVNILSKQEVSLSVWERGCGITLACGTGACATVVAGILHGYLDNKVKVNLPGGSLFIEWQGAGNDVYMTGPANYSFVGQIEL